MSTPATLSDEERAWLEQDEKLWARAHRLAACSGHDASGLYHTLRNFERTPMERLQRGLAHARLRPQHG